MYSFLVCIYGAAALLLPSVAARRGGGGGGGAVTFDIDSGGPPLENATFAFYIIFLIATLAQLRLAITSGILRARSGHRLPGVGTVVALVFLAIGYALGVALVVGQDSVDLAIDDLNIATTLFQDWADPLMFAAVALVLRDRYLTHTKNNEETSESVFPLLPFNIASCTFFGLMCILSLTSVGIYGAAFNTIENEDIALRHIGYQGRIDPGNDVFYSFIAVEFVATAFLIAFAVAVKKLTKTDKISTLTLTVIMPLLSLRIISRVIFVIVDNRLPFTASHTLETSEALAFSNTLYNLKTAEALDFSSTLLFEIFYFAVAGMLVSFLKAQSLWDDAKPGEVDGAPHSHANQGQASPPATS